MYKILGSDGLAKRSRLETKHGTIETPVFMNVATQAAIKGALSAGDLNSVGCQVVLCNTYHLHLRPGEDVVETLGGLRGFMGWSGPVLTDSGGFQVYSLASMRRIKEEGVYFNSHIDGRKIFMGAEESMKIQSALGSTIAMAFDECAPYPCDRKYMEESVSRTTRWLERCKKTVSDQLLFGINQGGTFHDIRINHAKEISDLDLDGYALGGLAVGEPAEHMYEVLEKTVPHLPRNKPTYLMGVGSPVNIVNAVERGVDFFDCVMPARNGRHGHVYTTMGKLNLKNEKHKKDDSPIDASCPCHVCRSHSRAYIRHLFKAEEMLAMRLAVLHNLYYYNSLMGQIRNAIEKGELAMLKEQLLDVYDA